MEKTKPTCKLTETDGNIFALLGKACNALKQAGMYTEAYALVGEVFDSSSYDAALQKIMKYVEVE